MNFTRSNQMILSLSLALSTASFGKDSKKDDGSWVKTKNRGFYMEGILAGKVSSSKKSGVFGSKDITFSLSPLSAEPNFLPTNLKVTAHQDSIYEKIKNLPDEKPVIFKYVYANALVNLLNITRSSRYWVTEVLDPKPFEETDSFQNFGYLYEMPDSRKKGIKSSDAISTGYITHVARWGTFSTACYVEFLQKGTKTITVDPTAPGRATEDLANLAETAFLAYQNSGTITNSRLPRYLANQRKLDELDQKRQRNAEIDARVNHKQEKEVPNTSSLSIHSEKGCEFAEDAAMSGNKVKLTYSERYVAIFSESNTIHKLEVLKK